MPIAQSLIEEFDLEMLNTRATLERVPDSILDYTPHPKSFGTRALVSHLVNIPSWLPLTLNTSELVMDGEFGTPEVGSMAEALASFDAAVAAAKAALAAADDATMLGLWSLKAGGRTFFTMPRVAVIRGMIMNHLIHHRAQLGVYLRLNDVPLPAIYGPSADDTMGM